MKPRTRALLTASALILLAGCSRPDSTGQVIKAPGTYSVGALKDHILLTEQNGRMELSIKDEARQDIQSDAQATTKITFSGWTRYPAFPATAPWFVYPQSETTIWLNRGDGTLIHFQSAPNNQLTVSEHTTRQSLPSDAPEVVRQALNNNP